MTFQEPAHRLRRPVWLRICPEIRLGFADPGGKVDYVGFHVSSWPLKSEGVNQAAGLLPTGKISSGATPRVLAIRETVSQDGFRLLPHSIALMVV